MGVRIVVREGELIVQALRRLKKQLQRSGSAWEARRRADPVDRTQERRARRFRKRFKARQSTLLSQRAGEQPVASLAQATARFWERTGKP
jgi:ribosomal protein S21